MLTEILSTTSTLNEASLLSLAKDDKEEAKGLDFLSLMLQSLEESEELSPNLGKFANLENLGELEELINLEEFDFDEITKLPLAKELSDEIFELGDLEDIADVELNKASFMQILQLLEHINGKDTPKFMPKLNDKLQSLLENEKILSEFKEVKDLKGLLKLSQKYELGLEKIKFSTQEIKSLKKTFSTLEKNGFFPKITDKILSENILKAKTDKPTMQAKEVTLSLASLFKKSNKNETKQIKVQDKQNLIKELKKENKSAPSINLSDALNMKKNPQNSVKISSPTSQTLTSVENEKFEFIQTKEDLHDTIKDDHHDNTTKTISKHENLKIKSTNIKQTLNTFAQDFKEKVESYKPPVMKVQMALNPKNLGEMEVTILNRGNNLHINITSNATAMNLFVQNQAEFKNSLVNMGFTNLEMNFSDQKQGGDERKNKSNQNPHNTEEIEEEEKVLEIKLPYYV